MPEHFYWNLALILCQCRPLLMKSNQNYKKDHHFFGKILCLLKCLKYQYRLMKRISCGHLKKIFMFGIIFYLIAISFPSRILVAVKKNWSPSWHKQSYNHQTFPAGLKLYQTTNFPPFTRPWNFNVWERKVVSKNGSMA